MFNSDLYYKIRKERLNQKLSISDLIFIVKFKDDNGPLITCEGQHLIVDSVYVEWWEKWEVKILSHNYNNSHKTILVGCFRWPTHDIKSVKKFAYYEYRNFLNKYGIKKETNND